MKSTKTGYIDTVHGECPHCHEDTLLVAIVTDFYRCTMCGEETRQYVNGSIKYLKLDSKDREFIEKEKEIENEIEKELNILSPKMFEIMKNISKFINSDDKPTGKILFYSDFRSDAGSEAFELILKSNGLCLTTAIEYYADKIKFLSIKPKPMDALSLLSLPCRFIFYF